MSATASQSRRRGIMRNKADLRPIAFEILYFGLVGVAYLYTPTTWPAGIALFLALSVTSFQGAVQTHNAVHCPVFTRRGWNKAYQVWLTLTYGHPVSAYVPGHNLSHHKHTQKRADIMRTTKARFRYNLFNGLFFMPIVGPSIMRADHRYAGLMKTRLPRWYAQFRWEYFTLWTVQISLFVLDWRVALLYWLAPHLYAQWAIVTMNLLQHDGCDEDDKYNHSRNFVGGIVNWLMFNNGYHGMHHEQPNLHWSELPKAHRAYFGGNIHPNLEQKSVLWYLFRTFVLGKRERYDGATLVLPPAGEDEEWIPAPEETRNDLGAEAYG